MDVSVIHAVTPVCVLEHAHTHTHMRGGEGRWRRPPRGCVCLCVCLRVGGAPQLKGSMQCPTRC